MLARDLGFNYVSVRAANPLFKIWPFSSELKRMSVVIRTATGYRLFCKGASEAHHFSFFVNVRLTGCLLGCWS